MVFLKIIYHLKAIIKKTFFKIIFGKHITFGKGSTFRKGFSIAIEEDGIIKIGENVYFNNFYYDNPYVYQTKQFTTKMMALDIPLNSAYNYIIWCHPLDNLKNFISDLLKVNQYYISYYIHYNNFKLIIPFLSNNGITFQVYSILPKKPYNVKEDYYESMRMETKKLFSNKYKKYVSNPPSANNTNLVLSGEISVYSMLFIIILSGFSSIFLSINNLLPSTVFVNFSLFGI